MTCFETLSMTSYIWGDYPTSRIVDFGKFRMIEKMGRTEHTPIRYIGITILIEGNKRKVRKTEPFSFLQIGLNIRRGA